ncbi:hypothetical protein Lal_00015284 [Lupinus albus]|nr:hypothetical protein Lal_00015284 [Lupinus albus]
MCAKVKIVLGPWFRAHFGNKVVVNLREIKIDVEVVHKMGFSIDPVTCRTYRHRTDRPTTPTSQPEPTIPNSPEFHAPSSSSAAMPSNHIIMDELVSHEATSLPGWMPSTPRTKKSNINFIALNSKRKEEHTQDKSRNIIIKKGEIVKKILLLTLGRF